MNEVKRTERGWAGHFICSSRCRFRRNTLLEYKETKIVVSTVGLMESTLNDRQFDYVGWERAYETMVFHATWQQGKYWDSDVSQEVYVQGQWGLPNLDDDDKANDMHEAVVDEMTQRILSGEFEYPYPTTCINDSLEEQPQ